MAVRFIDNDGNILGRRYFEQSQMSEIAGWIPENLSKTQVSWLQKLRGYDDLQARCSAAESMRDHYKTVMTEALYDRDLHAKVADNWQKKLIEANNENQFIGKRLKFNVEHIHIEIIIGNPICVAKAYIQKDSFWDMSFSICNPKDVYNWKIGVVKALDNLCKYAGYYKSLRRELMQALAKKYPEVFLP